mmetsp:Transcript_58603/g.154961  ORF Transcript_58603/g.154961 Transcript_58603/m.154961 type:complete len:108 (+) Transcript_58603:92-415(+)
MDFPSNFTSSSSMAHACQGSRAVWHPKRFRLFGLCFYDTSADFTARHHSLLHLLISGGLEGKLDQQRELRITIHMAIVTKGLSNTVFKFSNTRNLLLAISNSSFVSI